MGVPNLTHQTASNAVAAMGTYISLHFAAAGTTGANEASGGGYARLPTVWTPDGTGNNIGSSVTLNCAAGSYAEAGIFSAVTAGTFVASNVFTGGTIVVSGTGATISVNPVLTC